ncbi:MAG: aspartate kinase [Rikenellaceae bacterium]|nr:aspartate kinase [Rikenellaceae bacterium]
MFQVLKFGGSSVANATNMSRVLDIVGEAASKGRVVLICSAIKGCTDELITLSELARKQQKNMMVMSFAEAETAAIEFAEKVRDVKARHLDIIRRLFTGTERKEAEEECHALFADMSSAPAEEMVTYGEVFSSRILARKLACDGVKSKWLDSCKLVIKDHKELTYSNIKTAVGFHPEVQVFVAAGFIASTYKGERTTLGRGGSDLSASIYAAALRAGSLQIWTDVPGIMTANPKDVPAAETIPQISYRAALDMASNGAKVLYAPSIEPAMEAGIAISIRNTFEPDNPGTIVGNVSLKGWAGVTGMEKDGEAKLCLVAEDAQNGEAACERVANCLFKAGIKALTCSSDGLNVYATLNPSVKTQALAAIHREFFENAPQSVLNLYLAGYGAVGKAFVKMLAKRGKEIASKNGKILRLVGLANSSRFIIDPKGIDPAKAAQRLEEGQSGDFEKNAQRLEGGQGGDFVKAVIEQAPRHSIFLDLTNSESIYKSFEDLLRSGLNIITSNRRSIAVPYVEYASMMATAAENGCFVRYETTVGNALPLLEGISRSANAGEEILSIEAVVSCTLNQILSSYARYPGSFAETVKKAQEQGLTEADVRQDLAGKDALRKLLILAREVGVPLEEEDVEIIPAVPKELMDLPMEEFYERLEALEPEFEAAEKAAARSQCRQRFLATLEKDSSKPLGYKATIAVQNVSRRHPAFRILGTENAIIIRSAYHPYPLVIQGAGEGARMAAGSIMNEILS